MSIAPRSSSLTTLLATLAATPPFGITTELITASSMTYDGGTGLSTKTLTATSSSVAKLQGAKQLYKSGAAVMKRVSGTPSAPGEFAITGATLTIYGDVTASGDTYTATYPVA